jgi:hypothetical protein
MKPHGVLISAGPADKVQKGAFKPLFVEYKEMDCREVPGGSSAAPARRRPSGMTLTRRPHGGLTYDARSVKFQ